MSDDERKDPADIEVDGFTLFYQAETRVSGPCCIDDSLIVCSESGDTIKVSGDGVASVYVKSTGCPAGVAFDSDGGVYICDTALKSILTMTDEGLSGVVVNYEEQPLKGPSSVVVDQEGVIFFSDSGAFGETSLSNPTGSLFSISGKERVLQPLLHKCLANPCGVAVYGTGKQQVVYVVEQGRNRVLRAVQYPEGVFHASVFYQFSGGVGPAGVCCDSNGNVYVARADFGGSAPAGVVSILSTRGELLGERLCPHHHLTGIAIGGEANPFLYVTEESTCAVYRIHISELV